MPITNAEDWLSQKDIKSQLDSDYANLRSRIENKSQNIKALKGTGPENLSNPKFIAHKAIMDPKTYESKLS